MGALLAVVDHDLVVLGRGDEGAAVVGKVQVVDGFLERDKSQHFSFVCESQSIVIAYPGRESFREKKVEAYSLPSVNNKREGKKVNLSRLLDVCVKAKSAPFSSIGIYIPRKCLDAQDRDITF